MSFFDLFVAVESPNNSSQYISNIVTHVSSLLVKRCRYQPKTHFQNFRRSFIKMKTRRRPPLPQPVLVLVLIITNQIDTCCQNSFFSRLGPSWGSHRTAKLRVVAMRVVSIFIICQKEKVFRPVDVFMIVVSLSTNYFPRATLHTSKTKWRKKWRNISH